MKLKNILENLIVPDVTMPRSYCGPAKFWYRTELWSTAVFRWVAVFLISFGIARLVFNLTWPDMWIIILCGHGLQVLSGALMLFSLSRKYHYDRVQKYWWQHLATDN
jgi:hypothetical protein